NPHLRRFRISDWGEYLQVLIGQQVCIWLAFMDSLKHGHNSLRFSICSENRSLCVAFSFKDRRLTYTFSRQSVRLILTFSGQNCRTSIAFGAHLFFHRILNSTWWVNSFELNA